MSIKDRKGHTIVRELAQRVAELAQSAENRRRQKMWCDLNSLRRTERPPVICHPGSGVWAEVLPRTELVAKDPYLAGLEYQFRATLFKWEVGDDTVVDPWMPVHTVMRLAGDHFWGLPIKHIRPADADRTADTRSAWQYEPPIRAEADIEKIVPPRYTLDAKATQVELDRMRDLLGDILPVRQVGWIPGPGAWLHGWATELRGVEQLLFDLMDRPAWVHRLMRILRDGFLGVIDQFERANVLTLNNLGLMACDDLPGKGFDSRRVRVMNLWGRGESQEFQSVSPAQYEEFLLQYQKPILSRFGLTYYGCCEDLTHKMEMVLSVPNLRKFVCSPWTDFGKLAARVRDRYVIEWRQKASDVVYPHTLTEVRRHLERGLAQAHGGHVMIVLQELETLGGHPRRLHEWAKLAKAVGARAAR